MTKTVCRSLWGSLLVLASLSLAAASARAEERQIHHAACQLATLPSGATAKTTGTSVEADQVYCYCGFGGCGCSAPQDVEVLCPIDGIGQTQTLTVHGRAGGSGQVKATACVSYVGVEGGECGPTVTSSGVTDNYNLSPPLTSLPAQNVFGYVSVKLPMWVPAAYGGGGPQSRNTLRGIVQTK